MKRGWSRRAMPVLFAAGLVVTALALPSPDARGQSRAVLDHFWCYIVSSQTPQPAVSVTLEDQFQRATVSVDEPLQFCTPVAKTHAGVVTPIRDENAHLTLYPLPTAPITTRTLVAGNQFGAQQTYTVDKAQFLFVPTQKAGHRLPRRLDHFWCYPVSGPAVGAAVLLDDQFSPQPESLRVEHPRLFCNPVEKTRGRERTRIQNPDVHLVCYEIKGPQRTQPTAVGIQNQFETDTFTITAFELLCAPSTKTLP